MAGRTLERSLERMVVGVFSRGNRSKIRPIELGRRLVREMDDQQSVDVQGRRVVPNHFRVQLNERDLAGFAEIDATLTSELVAAAKEYATAEGYHLMGPVGVELTADSEQKAGRFQVTATIRDEHGADTAPKPPESPRSASSDAKAAPDSPADGDASLFAPPASAPIAAAAAAAADGTAIIPPPPPSDSSASDADDSGATQAIGGNATLVRDDGTRVPLEGETITVGRLSASTITINDSNVSRRHAEIRRNRGQFVVVDLGSTNGTTVNGTRIHGETTLSDGDVIGFGSATVRFEGSSS